MVIYCRKIKCKGSVDTLTCVYKCKIGCKIKCLEYAKNYQLIKDMVIEEKYIEHYGTPEFPLPLSMRKRRKRKDESSLPNDI